MLTTLGRFGDDLSLNIKYKDSNYYITDPKERVIKDLHLQSNILMQFNMECPTESNVYLAQNQLERKWFQYSIAIPKRAVTFSGEFVFRRSRKYTLR